MKTVYQTNDNQTFDSFDEAHEHECSIFDRWAARPTPPDALLAEAACLAGQFSGTAEEVLTQVFMGICY